MSASSITDGLIDNLSATSAIGGCQVGTHWATLETTTACCAVISLAELESNRFVMNNEFERFYTHEVTLFQKDRSGNAEIIERDLQRLVDVSVCSLEADPALQGSPDIRELQRITVSHDAKTGLDIAGATWYTAEMKVRTKVWPNNT